MALELNKSVGKKQEIESLNDISGSDDWTLVKAGETFADGNIVSIVPNVDSTITSLLAGDELGTELITGVTEGLKNINGETISRGMLLTAGSYSRGRYYKSVTCGTGSLFVYYNYKR